MSWRDYAIIGAKEVRELLDGYGIRSSKAKGQNFLVDANIPEKIVRSSGIDKSCGVLEIGPGLGALTGSLSLAAGRVVAVELDGRLVRMLGDAGFSEGNVEIVHGDILKIDIRELAGEKMQGLRLFACANLPYSITTPALTALIDAGVFEAVTVMVQKEVALRLCAAKGTADYGAISVYAQYHAEPRILFDVPPECFVPRPGVVSSVLSLKMRTEGRLLPQQEALFFRVVRAAFNQRRKTLVNALFSAFGDTMGKDEISAAVSKSGFAPDVRGEALDVAGFVVLSGNLFVR